MGKKTLGVVGVTAVLVTVMAFYFYDSEELYGNDKESIVEVIKSVEGYEEKQIEILRIDDFKDNRDDFNSVRVVAFLSDNNPSYVEFDKNEEGNYVFKQIETVRGEALGTFLVWLVDSKLLFVTNHHNESAKVQVEVNGNLLVQKLQPYEPSARWLELPETNDNHYEFRNYKFFDKDGNLIKEF